VWAFGVLLWEVYADCVEPYPGLNNAQTKEKVTPAGVAPDAQQVGKEHYRMKAPDGMPSEARDLMTSCWHAVGRPPAAPE